MFLKKALIIFIRLFTPFVISILIHTAYEYCSLTVSLGIFSSDSIGNLLVYDVFCRNLEWKEVRSSFLIHFL